VQKALAISLFVVATTGCFRVPTFPSLEGAVEQSRDDSLVGRWRVIDTVFGDPAERQSTGAVAEITESENGYVLTSLGRPNDPYSAYEFAFFDIEGRQFIQVRLDQVFDGVATDRCYMQLLERGNGAFRLRDLNREWIEQQFESSKDEWTLHVSSSPNEIRKALASAPLGSCQPSARTSPWRTALR